jgi:hypothetical protein
MTDKSYGDDVESHSYTNHYSHIPPKKNSKRMETEVKMKRKDHTRPHKTHNNIIKLSII